MPGCSDAVTHGETGWICNPGDLAGLTGAIEAAIDASAESLRSMGQLARRKMEREFDEDLVLRAYLQVVAQFSQASNGGRPQSTG
jgi:glycosyltransferase involved in cell wall biosynthesis